MKTNLRIRTILVLLIGTAMFFSPEMLTAQKMRGGGASRQAVSRPTTSNSNRSINGGSTRPAPSTRPSTSQSGNYSGNTNKSAGVSNNRATTGTSVNTNNRTNPGTSVNNNSRGTQANRGNSNTNINTNDRNNSGNNINSGNNNNINNSRNNINIDNSRNVIVRPPVHPYPRPPYAYGGYHYNCYHPYHYHPYSPYYYGPAYNPWGFFVTTLAVTAIVVSVNSQPYYYDQGVYYIESTDGYTVVEAPVGATVKELPKESQTLVVNETTNNYYYAGTYYEKTGEGYTVVPPTAGTVVENLPEGGEEVKIGDVTYVKFGNVYYQPIEKDGKSMYEVVEVKEAEG